MVSMGKHGLRTHDSSRCCACMGEVIALHWYRAMRFVVWFQHGGRTLWPPR